MKKQHPRNVMNIKNHVACSKSRALPYPVRGEGATPGGESEKPRLRTSKRTQQAKINPPGEEGTKVKWLNRGI